jgi:hypothetical protein
MLFMSKWFPAKPKNRGKSYSHLLQGSDQPCSMNCRSAASVFFCISNKSKILLRKPERKARLDTSIRKGGAVIFCSSNFVQIVFNKTRSVRMT